MGYNRDTYENNEYAIAARQGVVFQQERVGRTGQSIANYRVVIPTESTYSMEQESFLRSVVS